MGRIAREHHTAVGELIHATALEFVKRYPLELELFMAEHPRDPRPHILRPLFDYRVSIGMELEIDPPDIVRLLVQQRGAPGMERWVEPEPTLGRKFRRHPDIGDQELVLENFTGEFRPDHPTQRRPSAIAGRHMVRPQPVRTVRYFD